MKTKTKKLNPLFRRAASALLCFLLLFSLFGCSEKKNTTEKEGIKVVATLFPQYSLAKEIAKDRADVVLLLPPGVDSHSSIRATRWNRGRRRLLRRRTKT